MGYRCTVHLVDEASIRAELVPALLGSAPAATVLERVRPDGSELLDEARAALASRDQARAARLLCRLAVLYSACQLPHLYSGALALGLWQRGPGHPASLVALGEDPGLLFAPVVEQHPQLAGHFPLWLEGHLSTGAYISAGQVPAALEAVRASLAGLLASQREAYAPVVRVLSAAAAHGLAYWEASGLSPTLVQAELLDAPDPPGVARWPWPCGKAWGDASLHGDTLLVRMAGADTSVLVDLKGWPPAPQAIQLDSPRACTRLADGGWLSVHGNRQRRPFRFPLFRYPSSLGEDGTRLLDDPSGSLGIAHLAVCGGEVLAWCQPPSGAPRLARLRGGALQDVEAPPAHGVQKTHGRFYVHGHVALGCGQSLVIWDGRPYPWHAGLGEPWPVRIEPSHARWTAVPWGEDGFYYLSARRLYRVRRGQAPEPISLPGSSPRPRAPRPEPPDKPGVLVMYTQAASTPGASPAAAEDSGAIVSIAPGPEGTLLVRFGETRTGLRLGVLHPEAGTLSGYHLQDLSGKARQSFCGAFWSPFSQRIYLVEKSGLLTLDIDPPRS